jgi:antitoxin component of MazEF toxin-antitoxin module
MDKNPPRSSDFRQIPLDFDVKVVAVAGSLRMTIPTQLAKELALGRGDTVLVSLVEVGSDSPLKALLVRKKG